MQQTDIQATTMAYLDAFEARDLARCLDFYADDATLIFQTGHYEGKEAIERWHRDRFAADLRLVHLDGISVRGDSVKIDATATSNRLRAWKVPSIHGTVTLTFDNGKIKEAMFGVRMGWG